MNSDKARQAVIEEAADWVLRLHESEPSAEDRQHFVRWLKRSPLHISEFLQSEADWLALEDVDAARAIDVEELLVTADENVVALRRRDAAPTRYGRRRSWLPAAGLAAAAVLACLLFVIRHAPETYETILGEQRSVVLADGSIVELNTQSRIRVRSTDDYRDIDLLAGEALFSVAPDPGRPFRVFSDAIEVRATGTQFNVYRQATQTVVTVLEGSVEVRNRGRDNRAGPRYKGGSPAAGSIGLAVGDRAVARASAITRDALDDPQHAIAWRERRLVFENERLADVAAEFNRYNSRRIVIQDEALAARRINGVFDADRPEAIVQFLIRNDDAEIVEQPGARWVLRSRR